MIVKLAIANIYYHQGQVTQVKMEGLATTYPVTLIDTSYYGEVISIAPESSTGDQDIVITGRAVERAGGDPLPGVPVLYKNSSAIKTTIYVGLAGEKSWFFVRQS